MSERPPFHRHLKYDFEKGYYVDEDGAAYRKITITEAAKVTEQAVAVSLEKCARALLAERGIVMRALPDPEALWLAYPKDHAISEAKAVLDAAGVKYYAD